MTSMLHRAGPLTAAALLLAAVSAPIRQTSAVFDEDTYLQVSRRIFEHADFTSLWQYGVAPLPVLAAWALPAVVHPETYHGTIALARVSAAVLFGIPVVLLAWRWLARTAGEAAAAVGAALLALSPNLVAHASLATTDVCFVAAALWALFQLECYLGDRSRRHFVLLAVALGTALASKYGAIGLFPVVALLLQTTADPRAPRGLGFLGQVWRTATATAGLFIAAFGVAWAVHGFALGVLDPRHLGVRLVVPAPLYGIAEQLRHASLGHDGFLLGERRHTGWWLYTPIALFLKSTPVEIVLLAAAVCALVATRRTSPASARVWQAAFVVYLALAMTSRVNIGVRYVLLLLPLAVMAGVSLIARHARKAPRAAAAIGVFAVALQAWSLFSITPHVLSYFNAFVGGPAEGYRLLADSNVDWGQDLPALREALEEVGAVRPLVAYFGTAPFDAYGVRAVRWPGTPEDREAADWLAISATYLDGVYREGDPFEAFRSFTPSARAAYSIFLYRVDRPEIRQAILTAASRDLRE